MTESPEWSLYRPGVWRLGSICWLEVDSDLALFYLKNPKYLIEMRIAPLRRLDCYFLAKTHHGVATAGPHLLSVVAPLLVSQGATMWGYWITMEMLDTLVSNYRQKLAEPGVVATTHVLPMMSSLSIA